jgi:predicted RNA-binding Zn ribbon-like protein
VIERNDVDRDGGAPRLGEPLAIEFANTHYAVRGQPREGIGTPAHLVGWLRDNAGALGFAADDAELTGRIDSADVAEFRALRTAIRAIARAIVEQQTPNPHDVRMLNRAAARAPRWPELDAGDGRYSISEHTRNDVMRAALASIARDAIRIFGGPPRTDLRACQGPRCVLFYIEDHPRRAWCSAACGNRARAARHYRRHHGQPEVTDVGG